MVDFSYMTFLFPDINFTQWVENEVLGFIRHIYTYLCASVSLS